MTNSGKWKVRAPKGESRTGYISSNPSFHGLSLMNMFHHNISIISILRIATKNVARIRAVMLVAKTHQECCGCLDDVNKTLGAMDTITSGLAGHGPITTSHLAKQRGIQSPLKMLRQYSSTVHGCNLVLHRFNGTVKEKTALLREFKKSCDRTGVTVPKTLLSWLAEEASSGS